MEGGDRPGKGPVFHCSEPAYPWRMTVERSFDNPFTKMVAESSPSEVNGRCSKGVGFHKKNQLPPLRAAKIQNRVHTQIMKH